MDKATGSHYGVPTCEGCKVNFYVTFSLNNNNTSIAFFSMTIIKYIYINRLRWPIWTVHILQSGKPIKFLWIEKERSIFKFKLFFS